MAEKTNISWCDATYNPWVGCHKVSSGCLHCYMERDMVRYGRLADVVKRAAPSTFDNPLKWQKNSKLKPGSKIFTCSWSDFFIEEADKWRDEVWNIIKQTPEYTYLILTKRQMNIESRLPKDWGSGWDNVWLGITTEDQLNFDKRIEQFRRIPAKIHFLSVEPMLGNIEIGNSAAGIDWIVCGGESGRQFIREMRPEWAVYLLAQCRSLGIPFFMKQMGSYWAKWNGSRTWKGEDILEWPEELRIQEFPNG